MERLIFLDIDGVLNGYNKFNTFIWSIIIKLPKPIIRFCHKYFDIFGIHPLKVFILSRIVKKTNAKLIMSSTWRYDYWYYHRYEWNRCKELDKWLNKFNMKIHDATDNVHLRRDEEIQKYLDSINDKVSFIILDDELSDLINLKDHLIQTSSIKEGEIIKGKSSENTGLKFRHIKESVNLFYKLESGL